MLGWDGENVEGGKGDEVGNLETLDHGQMFSKIEGLEL
jgi:hypothetical protein